jgi:hypothetical protein
MKVYKGEPKTMEETQIRERVDEAFRNFIITN